MAIINSALKDIYEEINTFNSVFDFNLLSLSEYISVNPDVFQYCLSNSICKVLGYKKGAFLASQNTAIGLIIKNNKLISSRKFISQNTMRKIIKELFFFLDKEMSAELLSRVESIALRQNRVIFAKINRSVDDIYYLDILDENKVKINGICGTMSKQDFLEIDIEKNRNLIDSELTIYPFLNLASGNTIPCTRKSVKVIEYYLDKTKRKLLERGYLIDFAIKKVDFQKNIIILSRNSGYIRSEIINSFQKGLGFKVVF